MDAPYVAVESADRRLRGFLRHLVGYFAPMLAILPTSPKQAPDVA